MAAGPSIGYGTPNLELIGRWLELDAAEDGPFWALNLMRYRSVADYGGGESEGRSGREADDAYAPTGPLAAVGAMVALHADVDAQLAGEPRWDRVGIVRYPSRRAFFAMQRRDDFKAQHVHKEAGMESTIVLSCLPTTTVASRSPEGVAVLTVERGGAAAPAIPPGATAIAELEVEGVIVGDDRRWDRARLTRARPDALIALADRSSAVDEAIIVTLRPGLDRLVESIETAPPGGCT